MEMNDNQQNQHLNPAQFQNNNSYPQSFQDINMPTENQKSNAKNISTVIGLLIVIGVGVVGLLNGLSIEYFLIYPVVWLFFIGAAKFLPNKKPPVIDNATLEALGKKYGKIYFYIGCSIFAVTPILVFIISKLLYELQQYLLQNQIQSNEYVIGITIWAYVVPAIFIGILLWKLLASYFLSLYGKLIGADPREWDLAMYYMDKQSAMGHDIDMNKLMYIMAAIIVPISLIAFYLAMDNYSKITDKGIAYNGYFDLKEKYYPYSEVTKILNINQFKNAQSGQIESTSPSYKVITKNGFKWSTLNTEINNTDKEIEIVNYISQKSGVPITTGVHNIED